MPAKKKETVDKIQIKSFKDGSSHWFVNYAHYYLNKNNELLWASGESDNEEYRTSLEAFIKRNKKTFKPREQSILDKEEKVYMKLDFGLNKDKRVDECDHKYLQWILKNFNFAGKENLEKEIKEFLGK